MDARLERLLDVMFKQQDRISNELEDATKSIKFLSNQVFENAKLARTLFEGAQANALLIRQMAARIAIIETKVSTIAAQVADIHKAILRASVIEFYTLVNNQLTKVEQMNLKIDQSLPLSIQIKDAGGNAAQVDGAPAWSLTNPAMGELTVAEDGMSASLVPAGLLGAFKVQVSADADLGEGVETILGELDIVTIAGTAVLVEIGAGEPVDI